MEEVPHELTHDDIEVIQSAFVKAAQRAYKAGFKVIELHAAHGYLINQFLSPLSNHRTDGYGGSFENRTRFLLEIVEKTRAVWPDDLPLVVRISATEWVEGGWSKPDSVKLAGILKDNGVDMVDCSTGGNVAKVRIPLGPGYQVEFAEAVRATGIITGTVGLITTAQHADEIIRGGKADVVSMARQLIRDPYFPLRAAHELGQEVKWPEQYERAKW
jgi:2,4-dienoyl-CoA reductase-like NADH-dependent reductase (Old Yellow Enzyme family)